MTRRIRFRRFPMIWKFLIGCGVLASLLIVGSAIVVHKKTKRRSRGKYIARHYNLYLNYQQAEGRGLASAADLIASDPGLRAALGKRPATESPAAPNVVSAGGDQAAAARIAKSTFEVLSAPNAVRPDLMVVFDRSGNLVWSSPRSVVAPADLRQLQVVAAIRGGTAFFNEILVHRGTATLFAGVPIRALDGDGFVGGVILGGRLDRYMGEYHTRSSNRPTMRYEFALVHGDHVVASVWPEVKIQLLEQQLRSDHWAKASEGDETVDVIDMKEDGDYDFHLVPVRVLSGTQGNSRAQLFMLRSRADLRGLGPKVPWIEMIIGACLSLIIAFALYFWITRPIKRFVDQSHLMLQGETDLTQRVELSSRDETRELAENINQVFDKLYSLASEVQSAAFQVGASSAEISAASKQMLVGLKDQTLKIEGSTAAVTELSASIQQVAANAGEATKAAEKSNVAVTSAQQRMAQIRDAVEVAAGKMQELGDSSKRIGNIVEVIRQISEQTSLLALNASIEAAHAGEQGRGFAVVADEVSSLARRVGQSAKDIEALIQTIKEQTSDAIRSMDVGSREVESGTELVTSTLADLQQLIAVIRDTAVAVQEQAVVSDEIARNMDAVQKIAGDVLGGSEESVVQAEQLHELAFNLEQSVRGFNLDGARSAQRLGATQRKELGPGNQSR